MVLGCIVSLLVDVVPAEGEPLVNAFCAKLGTGPFQQARRDGRARASEPLRGVSVDSPLRYDVYYNLVKAAAKTDMIMSVFQRPPKGGKHKQSGLHMAEVLNCYQDFTALQDISLKSWMTALRVPVPRVQRLLRALHEALLECRQGGELASRVMVELLSTYTEDNASQARDDAHRCIVSCLADPTTFLLDHLLPLKPVRFLEGELVHDLLPSLWPTSCPPTSPSIRYEVHRRLRHLVPQANKDFVSSLGLSHEQSLHKMRLLTLMQLAESRRELPFELLQQELQLQDVEGFVVEALRTRMLTAKIDQTGRKVIVGTTVHRTFGRHQWVQLKESLVQWHERLRHVESSMDRVTRAHFEPLTAPTA
ncbi:hypothetical protein HPB52_014857 [Rhipicephalus sanguineus]|uniref:PCI domain-containing protein n=1 Tax=Rhipicephalus sanguineus TaxID=34632 RepID=A0A9D4PM09_RHISA|nr:hypothetical protein HPB52_014857 [Rhipicephalus sanguineus]